MLGWRSRISKLGRRTRSRPDRRSHRPTAKEGRTHVRRNTSITLLIVLAACTAYAQYLPPGTWKHLPSQSIQSGTITVQNYLRGISMVGDDWGVSVGYANLPNGPQYAYQTLIEQVTQTGATIMPSWNSSYSVNQLYAVSADSFSHAVAVGGAWNPCCIPEVTITEQFNGSAWTPISCPNPGTLTTVLQGVKSFGPDDVWIVGWYEANQSGAPQKTYLAHYDGSRCTQVASPNPSSAGDALLAISGSSDTDLWMCGREGNANSYHPICFHYSGTSFTTYVLPQGPGNNYGGQINAVSEVSTGDSWGGGQNVGYSTLSLYDNFNGGVWQYEYPQLISGPVDYTPIHGVAGIQSNFVWSVSESAGACEIGWWNGVSYDGTTRWNSVPCPQFGQNYNVYWGLDAHDTNYAFAAGNYNTLSGPMQTSIAMYSVP